MKRRRITDWHRSRIRNCYERTGSVKLAAAAAGVSLPTAYRVLEDVHTSAVNLFPVSLKRRVVAMYREGMSTRKVAAALAEEMNPAPSKQWVYEAVRDAGELRTKSDADRLQNKDRTGKDYEALEHRAVHLVLVENRSLRETAELLDVSRNMVARAVGMKRSPSEATRVRAWHSPHAKERQERLQKVGELHHRGHTQPEIAKLLGMGKSTVGTYLKRLGLTGTRKNQKRSHLGS